MRKRAILCLLAAALLVCSLCGCGARADARVLKIAVLGDPATFYPSYQEGILRAERDLNQEYAADGYQVVCEFYNDSDNYTYEETTAIVDALAADPAVTAVIGPIDMEIGRTAAHMLDAAGKLFVSPNFLYDDVYENHYHTVFSLCYSAQTVGATLKLAASVVAPGRRWAVAAPGTPFEQDEIHGFLHQETAEAVTVVDCVSISDLQVDFQRVYRRWEALGVEGVVLFPAAGEGFELLKALKRENPDLLCGGDTAFDNTDLLEKDPELTQAMDGFILVSEFAMHEATPEEEERVTALKDDYLQETGLVMDDWYLQGYNAVRAIADTAVRNQTTDPLQIAQCLHADGYHGLTQDFAFDADGRQKVRNYQFGVLDQEGWMQMVMIQLPEVAE